MASKRRVDELLLSNHVKHAESHNKVQEEKEMWQQRGREKDDWSDRTRMNFLPPPISYRGHLVSDVLDLSPSLSPSPPPRGYYSDLTLHRDPKKSTKPSNYWKKKLLEYEENDPLRWGHSGYKDHHPEEFASTGNSGDEDKICHRPVRKRKKRASLMNSVTKKTKYEEKREKRTILTRKKRTSDCNSSSEGSANSSRAYRESRRQKRRRRGKVDERRGGNKMREVVECVAAT